MLERHIQILKAIIQSFTETASPVSSKFIVEKYEIDVSPATIRNDMAMLEKEGFITQPHTSAGRIPTEHGYRFFVDEFLKTQKAKIKIQEYFEEQKKIYLEERAREKVYDAVAILSRVIPNIGFASMPGKKRTFYLGLANMLKQPEFLNNLAETTRIIEVLEEGFFEKLNQLNLDDTVKIFIGEENIIPQIQSCSLMATRYKTKGYEGIIGVLGPMRMDYAYNDIALEYAVEMIRE